MEAITKAGTDGAYGGALFSLTRPTTAARGGACAKDTNNANN